MFKIIKEKIQGKVGTKVVKVRKMKGNAANKTRIIQRNVPQQIKDKWKKRI